MTHYSAGAGINQNGEHHRLAYHPNGLVSEEHTVDGRHFLYNYDLNGHLTQRTEYGTSQSEQTALVTRYERDAAGRLVRKVLPNGKEVSYAYDTFNRLRLVDDGHWPLAYGYDEIGRLTEEYQGFASLFYGYDSAGNLTRQRLPDGNLLAYHYQQGQVSRIDLNGRILSEHQYRGERETRRITGEVVSEFDYDAQQRLRHQRATAVVQAELEGDAPDVTPVMQRRYEYDPAGNLTQILDPHKGNREYRYDKQHRLTEALHHPIAYPEALPQALRWRGISEQFTHDAAGNVLGNDAASRGTQVRGNLLKQKGDVRFEYDEFGNLTREVRSTKPLWVREFRYDCQHRLVEFIEQRQGQKTHFAYTYDAFGRRIQKQDLLAQRPNAITRFFWQGERMVAECADDDNIFTADDPKPAHLATYKSYLYSPGSFVPLAQLLGKGRKSEIYYYLNDHLGTPQELVNGKGQIAWSAAYRAYGNLAVAFIESVPQPLRFQGQYFDAESGLHYNRHRYYSPETARFITPDPIGRTGGLNQTQYVPNPTGWVDPLGLTSVKRGCPPDSDIPAGVKTGEPDIPTSNGKTAYTHFPEDPNELTKVLGVPPKITETQHGTTRMVWQPNSDTRIRYESHPGDGGTFNARHHGEHYHIELKPEELSWGQAGRQNRVTKVTPRDYQRGHGTGHLPGEQHPGIE